MEAEKQTVEQAHERAADAAIAKVMDPERSPQAKVAKLFKAAREYPVHPTKQALAVAILSESADEAAAILDRCDYGAIEAFRAKFGVRFYYAGLSTPAVEQTPRDRYEKLLAVRGYLGDERDAIFARMKQGETLKIEWDHVVLGGQTITREAIRLGLKPRYSNVSDAAWLAKFPQMKKWIIDGNDIVFTGVGSA